MEKEQQNKSIGKKIGFLSRSAHIYLKNEFKNEDIGHSQIMTLHFICKNNGINQNELVTYFNLDKSSIASQLKILEKNNYIIRRKDPKDSRSRNIYITDKTENIIAEISEKFSSWSKILLDGISKEEEEILFNLLDKLKINAEKAIQEIRKNEKKK
jgi:DNA-binding MarR family transcriptional regulator